MEWIEQSFYQTYLGTLIPNSKKIVTVSIGIINLGISSQLGVGEPTDFADAKLSSGMLRKCYRLSPTCLLPHSVGKGDLE